MGAGGQEPEGVAAAVGGVAGFVPDGSAGVGVGNGWAH